MIYTPNNTAVHGKPIKILLDGVEVTYCFYLDRRRRVLRRFATDDSGAVRIDETGQDVCREEIRYGHRQHIKIQRLSQNEAASTI